MLLYTKALSNRLQYICETIFGNNVSITTNIEDVYTYKGFIINYSPNQIVETELHIYPIYILFENSVSPQTIQCFNWKNEKAFFKTTQGIGFDILAASFYLISRYEEYVSKERDEHFSFSYKNSLAFKENFLLQPLVNIWWELLKKEYPNLKLATSSFKFTTTFDVDIAFKYKHHGLLKNILSTAKELTKFKFKNAFKRWRVLLNYKKNNNDPYDVFDWLNTLHTKMDINTIFFCLCQLKRSRYDVNLSIHSKGLKTLYKKINSFPNVGIHPSYLSGKLQLNNNSDLLAKEIQSLENIIQQPIKKSRQHYLVMQLPNSYNTLVSQNIQEDYTMGYNYVNGFRASYCKPFYWFNVVTNTKTSLVIHPFCAMDSNFIFFGNYSSDATLAELKKLYDTVKKYDGELITVFHNHFADTQNKNWNWKKLYQSFLEYHHSHKIG